MNLDKTIICLKSEDSNTVIQNKIQKSGKIINKIENKLKDTTDTSMEGDVSLGYG